MRIIVAISIPQQTLGTVPALLLISYLVCPDRQTAGVGQDASGLGDESVNAFHVDFSHDIYSTF